MKAPKYATILKTLPLVRNSLAQNLSAVEYVDGYTYKLSCKNFGINAMEASDSDLFFLFKQMILILNCFSKPSQKLQPNFSPLYHRAMLSSKEFGKLLNLLQKLQSTWGDLWPLIFDMILLIGNN